MVIFVKNTQIIAERIKIQSKIQGITVKKLLENCELGVNTVTKMANGTDIFSQNLTKIADYLNVSVDYLLGRTDEPQTVSNRGSSISQKYIDGNATASITHGNKDTVSTDTTTDEFIQLFQSLDIADKIAVMNLALEKSKNAEN